MNAEYDVVIIGGGAAGLSAALYTTRAQLKTLVIEQLAPGGQLMLTSDIENYPGFPEGVLGPDLSQYMEKQAVRFGTMIDYDSIERLEVEGPVKAAVGRRRHVHGQGPHHCHRRRAQQAGGPR